jgi:hypothetical protein
LGVWITLAHFSDFDSDEFSECGGHGGEVCRARFHSGVGKLSLSMMSAGVPCGAPMHNKYEHHVYLIT